jgi:hypothetical protein
MTVDFFIVKSPLAAHPTGHAARVKTKHTITFEKLVDEVANRNTTVAKSEVLSVLEDFFETVEEALQDGDTVVTPHTVLRPSIQGNFDSATDEFDPQRHKIIVRISPGKRLRKAMRDVDVRKVEWDPPHPRPLTWYDVATEMQYGPITPGGDGHIIGSGLRFDPDDPRQGVFFIAADGTATRAENMVLNTPGLLTLHNPMLPAGPYRIEVRALVNNHEVRAGQIDAIMTVGAKTGPRAIGARKVTMRPRRGKGFLMASQEDSAPEVQR